MRNIESRASRLITIITFLGVLREVAYITVIVSVIVIGWHFISKYW